MPGMPSVGRVSGFAVTPPELAALDRFVGAAALRAQHAVDGLRVEAAGVLGSGWQGAAGGAFRLAWEDWLRGAELVVGALDELVRLTAAAAASYTGTDESVRAAVARQPT